MRNIGVLTDLPTSNDNISSSTLRWFTNNPKSDDIILEALPNSPIDIPFIGISIMNAVILISSMISIYRCVFLMDQAGKYILTKINWNTRQVSL
jgi:hypothetical protein